MAAKILQFARLRTNDADIPLACDELQGLPDCDLRGLSRQEDREAERQIRAGDGFAAGLGPSQVARLGSLEGTALIAAIRILMQERGLRR